MRPVIQKMTNDEYFSGIILILAILGIIYLLHGIWNIIKTLFGLYFVRLIILYVPKGNIKKKMLGIDDNLNMNANKYIEDFRKSYYSDNKTEMINALKENVKHCPNANRYCKYELFCSHCSFVDHGH